MPDLTPDKVEMRLVVLCDLAARKDNESAHTYEDELWEDVLKAIAGGAEQAAANLAAAALQSSNIEFDRWYA